MNHGKEGVNREVVEVWLGCKRCSLVPAQRDHFPVLRPQRRQAAPHRLWPAMLVAYRSVAVPQPAGCAPLRRPPLDRPRHPPPHHPPPLRPHTPCASRVSNPYGSQCHGVMLLAAEGEGGAVQVALQGAAVLVHAVCLLPAVGGKEGEEEGEEE